MNTTLPNMDVFTGSNMQLFWTYVQWALAQAAPGILIVFAAYVAYYVIRLLRDLFWGANSGDEDEDIDNYYSEEDDF